MKVQQARSKHGAKGHACKHCGKTIKAGEWFAQQHMRQNPITDRYFTLHVRCMKEMTVGVPEDEDIAKKNYDALRTKIMVAGHIFPD